MDEVKEIKRGKVVRVVLVLLAALLLITVALGVKTVITITRVSALGTEMLRSARETYEAGKAQDIAKLEERLAATRQSFAKLTTEMGTLSWLRFVPFADGYYQDVQHVIAGGNYGLEAAEIAVMAIKPYADLLGLKGQGTFTGGTIEDRIVKAAQTLDKMAPQFDVIAEKIRLAGQEIDQIDPYRYPETFEGKEVRSRVIQLKETALVLEKFLGEARPLVARLPYLLGTTGERKYLILFQNDAELRPTGGFMTAYAVFRVEKGQIHIDTADDIYKLDATITRRVAPPEPIKLYLREYDWKLRNTNFSPDFEESMKNFMALYNSSPQRKKIDGIIALDTQVLVRVMEVLGPVAIYGANFTTEKVAACDCPMVIWELEKYADEPKAYERGSRKDIIGILLQALMQKAMKAPKNLWGNLFQVGFTAMEEKHVLAYLLDSEAQKGVVALDAAGKIKNYPGDYLHISDANLGGAKSNLYITQSVKQSIQVKATGTETTLTIEYRHPRRGDNCSLERKEGLCLSGIYRDYVRVYLPDGAQLVEVRGFEGKSVVFSDLGKTVVDGFFTVVPLGLAKIEIKYTTPLRFSGVYQSLIQKQPGTGANEYQVTVNGKVQKFNLIKDREVRVAL